jgi:hypothetical protein
MSQRVKKEFCLECQELIYPPTPQDAETFTWLCKPCMYKARTPFIDGKKRCSECGELKPVESYVIKTDGRPQGRCHPCYLSYTRAYSRSRKVDIRKIKARWAQRNGGRVSARKTARYNSDPEYRRKVLARCKVYRAIKSGLLKRLPCQSCGDPKSHGHHHDYDKALEVHWLCMKCHLKEHGVEV